MRNLDNNTVPFYRLKTRPKTDHKVAVEYSAKGWTLNGKKYPNREAYMSAVRDCVSKLQSKTQKP